MKKFLFKLKDLGQTSLEYMLLLVVAGGIGMTFFKKVDEFLIKNPDSVITKQLKSFEALLEQDPNFKTYTLPR